VLWFVRPKQVAGSAPVGMHLTKPKSDGCIPGHTGAAGQHVKTASQISLASLTEQIFGAHRQAASNGLGTRAVSLSGRLHASSWWTGQ
jgi:hypothetical protein